MPHQVRLDEQGEDVLVPSTTPVRAPANRSARKRSTPRPAYRCKVCKGPVYRVHRHFLDRLINVFVRVRRFRCTEPGCVWEGRLAKVRIPERKTRTYG